MKAALLKGVLAASVLSVGAGAGAMAQPVTGRANHVVVHAPLQRTGDPSVHDWNGQRFDVPSTLLRRTGVLINGLPPQPQEFD